MSPSAVRAAAQIPLESNIWLLRPWEVTQRIEAIPYVQRAEVVRALPNRLSIRITERQPDSCIVGAGRKMTIDSTNRVLTNTCLALRTYLLPSFKVAVPGMTLHDLQLDRLRDIATLLENQGMQVRILTIDRDGGAVVARQDGVLLLLGDDQGMRDKIRLVTPIMTAAREHGQAVEQIDLRAPNTPVVRYRESQPQAQNRHSQ